jgi:hypothetical protein
VPTNDTEPVASALWAHEFGQGIVQKIGKTANRKIREILRAYRKEEENACFLCVRKPSFQNVKKGRVLTL